VYNLTILASIIMKFLKIFILLMFFSFFSNSAACAIKIGLLTQTDDDIYIGVSKAGAIIDVQDGSYLTNLEQMKPYRLKKHGNIIEIEINKKKYGINAKEIIIKSNESDAFVYTKKRWYRGFLIIKNDSKGLTVINELDMENYIKGVVPSEMPPGWNIEAHKAQAIAARSYAAANLGKRLKYGFDLYDTPLDQNYIGVSAETTRTNRAVDDTQGQVLVYGGKVIPAYYHASAGGSTLPAEQVWGKFLPYIKGVKSFDENVPCKGHRVGMSQTGANTMANMGYTAYQILGYFYNEVMLRKLY